MKELKMCRVLEFQAVKSFGERSVSSLVPFQFAVRTSKHHLIAAATLLLVIGLSSFVTVADANGQDETGEREAQASEIFENGLAVADTILAKHVSPPTRQEMFLSGLRAIPSRNGIIDSAKLATTLSNSSDRDSLRKESIRVLTEALERTPAESLNNKFINGMLTAVHGPVQFVSASEYRVQTQVKENQYIGIGIALGIEGDYPILHRVFAGGPAFKVGARANDQIIEVDGQDTKGMDLRKVIDLLRGPLDSKVQVTFRSPDGTADDTTMIRHVVPIPTVTGHHENEDGEWVYVLPEESTVAYLRFENIGGSTASEVRDLFRRLKQQSISKVILDFRNTASGDLHHTVMVADAFLREGTIGQVATRERVETYEATNSSAVGDFTLLALIDDVTPANVEWLCNGLIENRDLKTLGTPTYSNHFSMESIELPGGRGALSAVPTGIYLNQAGNLITDSESSPHDAAAGVTLTTRQRIVSLRPDHVVAQGQDPESGQDPALEAAISQLKESN